MFPFLGFVLSAPAEFADLAWTTVNLIPNLFAGLVTHFGVLTFLCADVSAVAIYYVFLSVQQFRCHGHIGDIGCRGLECVDDSANGG